LPFEGDFMGTLRAELSRHGSIKEITMGQGFAFLEYDSPDAAEKCLKAYEQQGFQIQGRDVTVERRNPSKASSVAAAAKKEGRRGPPRQSKAEAGKA
jgi:RNA recognition motif-containing protein